jgi:hypothetical protein
MALAFPWMTGHDGLARYGRIRARARDDAYKQ